MGKGRDGRMHRVDGQLDKRVQLAFKRAQVTLLGRPLTADYAENLARVSARLAHRALLKFRR
jgi:hypothetical protein